MDHPTSKSTVVSDQIRKHSFADADRYRAPWMSHVLRAAGIYNICWGFVVVCWPMLVAKSLGLSSMRYPEVWQYVGVLVGFFGLAYILAAQQPVNNYLVVMTGLLSKFIGPIGFVHAALTNRLPWRFGWTVVANDLIWWIPFGLILFRSYQHRFEARREASQEIHDFALRVKTNGGRSLFQMSKEQPLMLVFLRHTGCPFCRETLARLSRQLKALKESDTKLVLVHMANEQFAERFFKRFGLSDIPRVSDPNRALYRAFNLGRGNPYQIVGPLLWWQGIKNILTYGQNLTAKGGDLFQMPGVFLIYHGHVVRSFLHQTIGDKIDFLSFARQPSIGRSEALS